jgi:hypothetical protein
MSVPLGGNAPQNVGHIQQLASASASAQPASGSKPSLDARISQLHEDYTKTIREFNLPQLNFQSSAYTYKQQDQALKLLKEIDLPPIEIKTLKDAENLSSWVTKAQSKVKAAESFLTESKSGLLSKVSGGLTNRIWDTASKGSETKLSDALVQFKAYIGYVQQAGISTFRGISKLQQELQPLDAAKVQAAAAFGAAAASKPQVVFANVVDAYVAEMEARFEEQLKEIDAKIQDLDQKIETLQNTPYEFRVTADSDRKLRSDYRKLAFEIKEKIWNVLSEKSPLNEKAGDLYFKCCRKNYETAARAEYHLQDRSDPYAISQAKYEKSYVKALTADIKDMRARFAANIIFNNQKPEDQLRPDLQDTLDFADFQKIVKQTPIESADFKAFAQLIDLEKSPITEKDLSPEKKLIFETEKELKAKQETSVKLYEEQLKSGTFDLKNSKELLDICGMAAGTHFREYKIGESSSHLQIKDPVSYAKLILALAQNPKYQSLLTQVNQQTAANLSHQNVEPFEELNIALFNELAHVNPQSQLLKFSIRSAKRDKEKNEAFNLMQLSSEKHPIKSDRNTSNMLFVYLRKGVLSESTFYRLVANEDSSFKKEMGKVATLLKAATMQLANDVEKSNALKNISALEVASTETLLLSPAELVQTMEHIKAGGALDEEKMKFIMSGLLVGGFSVAEDRVVAPDYKNFVLLNILLANQPKYNTLQSNLYEHLNKEVYPKANAKEVNAAIIAQVKFEDVEKFSKVVKMRVATYRFDMADQLNNFLEILPLKDERKGEGFDRSLQTSFLYLNLMHEKQLSYDDLLKMVKYEKASFHNRMKLFIKNQENSLPIRDLTAENRQSIQATLNEMKKLYGG